MGPLVNLLISSISILVSVAFYTMLERKILSYIQIRKGPNKVGLTGILQPFSDAIKLFNKNLAFMESMNLSFSTVTPAMSFLLSLVILSIIPFFFTPNFDNKFSILLLMVLSSLSVYSILMIGWSSNSKYAHMGAIRSMAQMISYEISFFLIVLYISILSSSYYFTQISDTQAIMSFMWGNSFLLLMWVQSCLAELNRSPFDFAEGESELVSGFNVEYMGGWFAMIFLAEYTNMIILSMVTVILFMTSMTQYYTSMAVINMSLIIIWARGSYPRFRYDLLMSLSWKMILPLSLFILMIPPLVSNMTD